MIKIFHKKERIKQSDLNSEQRKEIENNLYIESSVNINGKKLLIVDDVLTTGSTVKAMIKLLLPFKPKNIKVLVGARTLADKKDK